MNHWFFNKLGIVALVTSLVIALAAGSVFAGSSEQRAEGTFELAVGFPFGGASGEFKLRRDMDRFKFEAKGEGVQPHQVITFCVNGINIDVDDADDRGQWELDEDDPADIGGIVPDIGLGTVVKIVDGEHCGGGVILVATLTEEDVN